MPPIKKGSLIDSKLAKGCIRLFNSCYKAGVMDAERVCDEQYCERFKEEVRCAGVFGRVIDEHYMGWHEWRLNLLLIIGADVKINHISDFLMRLRINSGYSLCVLSLAQEFYIQGLDDFNAYPVIRDFSLFEGDKLQRWTRQGIVSRTIKTMIIDMQRFCIIRKRVEDASSNKKNPLKSNYYDWFVEDIWASLMCGQY